MNKREFIKALFVLLSFPLVSKAGILDFYKKRKESLPPEAVFTPAEELFIVDIKGTPESVKKLDISKYRLKIKGNIENPVSLSFDEIKSLPSTIHQQVFECVSNPPGGSKIGRIKVKGVSFRDLFKLVKPKDGTVDIIFRCFDDYSTSVSYDYALKENPILVYAINYDKEGKILKDLPLDHGYPVRIICPDKWGYKSAKWVKEIVFVKYDYKGYWESRGWSDRAKYKIDFVD